MSQEGRTGSMSGEHSLDFILQAVGGVQKGFKQGMTSPETILVAMERTDLRETKIGRSKIP